VRIAPAPTYLHGFAGGGDDFRRRAADYLGVRIHTGLSWSISLASEVAARRPSPTE
jgi:hypothetical protein